MTFTRVGVIVVITAVIVYFGLNVLLPRHTAEQAASSGTTPDQVFSSNAAATPAPPADSTPAAAAPAAATTASSDATPPPAASTTSPAASDIAGSSSSSGGSSSGAAPAQGLSEEEARKIAEEVGRKVATQVASSVVQDKQQPQASTEAAPASDAAASSSSSSGSDSSSSSSSSGTEQAASAAEPAAAPAPAETAAAPEAAPAPEAAAPAETTPKKKSKHTTSVAADSTPAKPAKSHVGQQSMDVISVWWPAVDKQSESQLNLLYAGEAASEKAAALLFSDNIGNAATASSHIQILNSKGKAASGHWEVSPQNARLLLFKTTPGRYTVILTPDLAGLSGKTLGVGLHGPVYVH